MSAPVPTGLLREVDQGFDLVMTRSLSVELAAAWAWLTESESTARWIGNWKGNGAQGKPSSCRWVSKRESRGPM